MSTHTIGRLRFERNELIDAREVAENGVDYATWAVGPANVFEPRWAITLRERLPVRTSLRANGMEAAHLDQPQAALLAEMAREMFDECEDLEADLSAPYEPHERAAAYVALSAEERRKAETARRTLRILSERSSTR